MIEECVERLPPPRGEQGDADGRRPALTRITPPSLDPDGMHQVLMNCCAMLDASNPAAD